MDARIDKGSHGPGHQSHFTCEAQPGLTLNSNLVVISVPSPTGGLMANLVQKVRLMYMIINLYLVLLEGQIAPITR